MNVPDFIDKMRSEPPGTASARRVVSLIGADPDIHVLGLAGMTAEIGAHLPPRVVEVRLLSVRNTGKRKGKQSAITQSMCETLTPIDITDVMFPNASLAVIESQEVYADVDAPRREMVAKANALIAIATVSGLLAGLVGGLGVRARLVLPRDWKGNRKKGPDHERTGKIVGDALVQVRSLKGGTEGMRGVAHLPEEHEHAMDALGMAVYAMNQLHRGIWT